MGVRGLPRLASLLVLVLLASLSVASAAIPIPGKLLVSGPDPAVAAEIGGWCDDFTLNRAAMAYLVAYAVAGGDAAVPTGPAAPSFTDVPTDYWAYRYIEYCLAKGIAAGYVTGAYGPADTATREQMAAFTSRALTGGDANVPAGPATATFVDVPTDYWAYRYIEYLNQRVVDTAYSTNPMTFEPGLGMSAFTAASWLAQGTGTQTDPCAARVTDFSAAPVIGTPPLTVAFTDLSRGGPTSWAWDFGDGGTAAEQNPAHVYTAVGRYTVALTTANTDGLDVKVKQDYIIVGSVPLINPGFDSGLDGWTTSAQGATVEPLSAEGRTLARIAAAGGASTASSYLYQDFPVREGDVLRAEALAFRHDVYSDSSVYIELVFYTAGGWEVTYSASAGAPLNDEWAQLEAQAVVPPGSVQARLMLVLHGQGEAWFDDASVTVTPGAPDTFDGTVTLDITDDIVCDSFIGCGAEDNGWFYGPDNAAYGVNESDAAIREGRIEWMRPGWVRMLCWYHDWCPSGDWQTFTFDSPNMESHYRTLALYQQLGTRLNLVGVEWAMADAYRNPQLLAQAVGALLEHLIREKGFTCIQDYTLTNEPNQGLFNWGYSFDDYVELERLLKAEFARRRLAVNLVASDDAQCLDLFTHCLNSDSIADEAGLYSSHFYATYASRPFVGEFCQDRMDLLALRSPRKPLVIGEFGFLDAIVTMQSDLYAVWTAAFGIEALNHGVSALSIWALDEGYYPLVGFMDLGLWGDKDQGWMPHPVYYAWAPFTRLARPGAAVQRGVSSHPTHVLGTVVGDTLFWVNQGDQSATVTIGGFQADDVRIMTATTVQGDRDTGVVEAVVGSAFVAPGQSFGYCRPRPFPDIAMGFWAYEEVKAAAAQGIVRGYDDGLYHPDRPVTRDQMAVYVSRALAGGDANVPTGPATATFSDVPTDYWAFKYVEYAVAQNVVKGYSDGTYKPTDEVDRGQMSVFIARAIATPTAGADLVNYTPPSTPTFPDVATTFWAYKYVEYIAQPSIAVTQGYPDGDYHPEYICARDQMAVYVARAFKLPL